LVKKSTYYLFVTLLLLFASFSEAKAQRVISTDTLQKSIPKDTAAELQTTVYYSAVDSTILDADKQIVNLYGNAKVKYGDISLEANYIRLDWAKNEVYAIGTKDTLTQKIVGLPVFLQGSDKYDSDEIRYNCKTKRAIIKGIVTQQGEGFVQGKNVKKTRRRTSTSEMPFTPPVI
jgi:lipopolysaccharide assembly outer membrane protein LptD (OstA)